MAAGDTPDLRLYRKLPQFPTIALRVTATWSLGMARLFPASTTAAAGSRGNSSGGRTGQDLYPPLPPHRDASDLDPNSPGALPDPATRTEWPRPTGTTKFTFAGGTTYTSVGAAADTRIDWGEASGDNRQNIYDRLNTSMGQMDIDDGEGADSDGSSGLPVAPPGRTTWLPQPPPAVPSVAGPPPATRARGRGRAGRRRTSSATGGGGMKTRSQTRLETAEASREQSPATAGGVTPRKRPRSTCGTIDVSSDTPYGRNATPQSKSRSALNDDIALAEQHLETLRRESLRRDQLRREVEQQRAEQLERLARRHEAELYNLQVQHRSEAEDLEHRAEETLVRARDGALDDTPRLDPPRPGGSARTIPNVSRTGGLGGRINGTVSPIFSSGRIGASASCTNGPPEGIP